MRKIVSLLIILVVCLLGLSKISSATAPTSPGPYTLPFTYNGNTYTKAFMSTGSINGPAIIYFYNNTTVSYSAGHGSAFPSVMPLIVYSVDDVFGNYDDVINDIYIQYQDDSFNLFVIPAMCFDSDYVRSSVDIYQNAYMDYQNPSYFCNFHFYDTSTLVIPASDFFESSHQLTVSRTPEAGGGIASTDEEIQCGVNGYNYCQADFPANTEVELEAYPTDSNWDFVRFEWNNGASSTTENPHTFTMDAAKTVTAVFFKTFRNAVGNFYDTSGTYGDGECVTYVKHETGITKISGLPFTGNAWEYYQEAIEEGYETSSNVPRIGAIVVFAIDTSKNMPLGHVGIVTAINGSSITIQDSNWVEPYTIGSHSENVNNYNILGYIYYTP